MDSDFPIHNINSVSQGAPSAPVWDEQIDISGNIPVPRNELALRQQEQLLESYSTASSSTFFEEQQHHRNHLVPLMMETSQQQQQQINIPPPIQQQPQPQQRFVNRSDLETPLIEDHDRHYLTHDDANHPLISQRQHPPAKLAFPFISISVILAESIILGYSIYLNHGFEPLNENPFYGPSTAILWKMGAKQGDLLTDHDGWRIVSAMFLNSGIFQWTTVIMEMISLGISIERNVGNIRFFCVFIVTGISGVASSVFFMMPVLLAGSTTSMCGLIGFKLIANFRRTTVISSLTPKMLLIETIGLVFSLLCYIVMGFMPFIDNTAQLGGFVCGCLCGLFFAKNRTPGKEKNWTFLVRLLPLCIWMGILAIVYRKYGEDPYWCQVCKSLCYDIYGWCSAKFPNK